MFEKLNPVMKKHIVKQANVQLFKPPKSEIVYEQINLYDGGRTHPVGYFKDNERDLFERCLSVCDKLANDDQTGTCLDGMTRQEQILYIRVALKAYRCGYPNGLNVERLF